MKSLSEPVQYVVPLEVVTRQQAEMSAWVQKIEHERDEALRIAKEATNGWACYARTKKEHDEIARLHRAIDSLTAGLW